jgi:hypothetical protein
MKILFFIIVCILFVFSLALSQVDYLNLKGNQKIRVEREHKVRPTPHLERSDDNRNNKLFKIGEKELPLQTQNGDQPTEQQLETIKNVLTGDFLVNDDTTGGWINQYSPSIAVNVSGNFVIVWVDDISGNPDIYYQRYDSSGIAQGVNTKANDDAVTVDQWDPSIAMDGSGNFVIVWRDYRNGEYNTDIYYQRYNSIGVAQGVNTKVNDDVGTSTQVYPSVALDEIGNFVIVWQDYRNGDYNPDIYYQRYDSSGIAQGINIKVNDDTGIVRQYFSSIAMAGSGNFVIVWEDYRNGNYDIYYQRYNSSGIAQGVNTKVNDDAGIAGQYSSSIAMDRNGNFVIVWVDTRNGDYWDIYSQRYNSSGIANGVNTKVNDDAETAHQDSPSIGMDLSGNFVVVWLDWRNGYQDIYSQRYNSIGVAQGVNTKVNDDAGADQRDPSIAMDGSGNFVIVWVDERNSYYNSDIYSQRYDSSGIAQGVNTKVNDDAGTADQWYSSVAMNGSGNFVVVWVDERSVNNWDIYFQRYNSSRIALGVNTKVNDSVGLASQNVPSIAMDGSGNFVVVWHDWRHGNPDIYYQMYNPSGIVQGVNTKVNDDAGTADQRYSSVAMDVTGNFVIVWQDERNGDYYEVYSQKYNSSGIAMGVNTKVNDAGAAGQDPPSIAMDLSGNFVVLWKDWRNGNWDIYYQRYNSSGIAQGVNTKVNDDDGTADQNLPSIAMDLSGNFVVVWQDDRNGNSDIYYHRYNSSGISQGVNTKINDDVETADQWYPFVAMDGSGNFVIVWEDYRYSLNNPDIIGQRYYVDGITRGANYRVVVDGPNYGEKSPVVAANTSQIVFSWMDNRRSKGWDIYAKIVGWDWDGITSVLSEKNIPTEFALLQNYPNPFNPSTTIQFDIPKASFVTLKAYNVLGQEVATLVNEKREAGKYQVIFDGARLSSGVYFYKLSAGNYSAVKKLLITK